MASQDVIELGSSEDEAEPPVKKIKPVPNAMVHIPRNVQGLKIPNAKSIGIKMPSANMPGMKIPGVKVPSVKIPSMKIPSMKIPGVTIKPTKSNIVSNISTQLRGKNVTITKVPKGMNCSTNPYNMNKVNKVKLVQKSPMVKASPIANQKKNVINPLNIIGKFQSNVGINKVPMTTTILKNPIRVQSPKSINNLPPCVTVKRTTPNMKRLAAVNVMNPVQKKIKLNEPTKTPVGEVLTVELDDDEMSNTTSASPQWYIRPEDDVATKMEKENNKEPDITHMVEITIEDSPVKPPCINKTAGASTDLPVIIEDSPAKSTIERKTVSCNNGDSKTNLPGKIPHSKKKLQYPNEKLPDAEKIEIEICPIPNAIKLNAVEDTVNEKLDTVIEIEESPLKVEGPSTSTPKKEQQRPTLDTTKSLAQLQEDDGLSEFNPAYREFIKLCFHLENSDDMKKIVEKKIKTYYREVPKEYTNSECFTDMVSSKILAMKAGPEKMYLYIKDIVDDLNYQRKLAKSQTIKEIREKIAETDEKKIDEESEYDSKRQRQIRKLEKTIKKLHRAIQKLETQEVDFDDDEDSVYLLTERYKERLVKVHAKLCQLTNTKMPSEPHVQIDPRPGRPAGPAKRIEKWINKKVPIGTPLPFPDFHDVLRCVRDANEEDNLGLNDADIMEEARDLFTRCGKKLQRRRQENEWRLAASRISTEVDPAEKSDELRQRLAENKSLAAKKETEVLNKYADRQSQLKLEAEVIEDKEVEESPVESDEEEPIVESPLGKKEERKKRLKRLLQEKSSKAVEGQHETLEKNKLQDNDGIIENINTDDNNTNSEMELREDKQPDSNINTVIENQEITTDNLDQNNDQQIATDKDLKSNDQEEIHSLSDDSKNVESDIDELHLLQKLYSENEAPTSTLESSDSESPIAISDTLGSSAEDKNHESDVISIENSTYSESEVKHDENDNNDDTASVSSNLKTIDAHVDFEIECSSDGVHKKVIKTNNDEYNESIEDILLRSTDDDEENESEKRGDTTDQANINNESIIHCNDIHEDATSSDSVTIITNKDDNEQNNINGGTLTKVCDEHTIHEPSNDVQDSDFLNIKLSEVASSHKNVKNTIITEIDDKNKQTVDDVSNDCNLTPKLDLECKSNKENIKLDSHD